MIIFFTTTSGGVVKASIVMEATLSGFIDRPGEIVLLCPSPSTVGLAITLPGLMLYTKNTNALILKLILFTLNLKL